MTKAPRVISGFALLPALFASSGGCGVLSPLSPHNLGNTRVQAYCHVLYECCTPMEQLSFSGAQPFRDEGGCVEELSADAQFAPSFFAGEAEAQDAVARGAAEFDEEAAERCSRPALDAAYACDPTRFLMEGQLSTRSLMLLVDTRDEDCLVRAQRFFVTGRRGEGEACLSSFDCEGLGSCEREVALDRVTLEGRCRIAGAEGESCIDGPCQPGLACLQDRLVCGPPELKANGERCTSSPECASRTCAPELLCAVSQAPCVDDMSCGLGDFCTSTGSGSCADDQGVTLALCDGRETP